MNMNPRFNVNKNRFRNLCLGFSFSCLAILWAFNIERPEAFHTQVIYAQNSSNVCFMPPITYFEDEPKPEDEPKKEEQETSREESNIIKLIDDHKDIKPVKKVLEITFKKDLPKTLPMAPPLVDPNAVVSIPDKLPYFPGGQKALSEFLHKNLKYPPIIYDMERSGTLVVQFIVDENGGITGVKVLKDELEYDALDEANRVLQIMPKWIPGMKDGKPVRTYFVQKFVFQMY
ncbi:MAG: protein TonB [Bacteroidia bacterium]|jgi:protein TonB